MPRIRTIKPEFWTDEKMAPMNAVERLTFLGLISMADDMGRLLDNVKIIDAFVFPETDETCREALARLSRAGRIQRGRTSSGQAIIQIVNWTKHQKVDKPSFKTCLPEIVNESPKPSTEQTKTPSKTSGSSDSANIRESVASESRERSDRTYDRRPRTMDHGPTTNDCNEAAPQPSLPPSTAPPAIDYSKVRYPHFPCIKSKNSESNVWTLTAELVVRFRETFPAVNIEAECRKAHTWIMANLGKRKTFGGMEDYLRRWLAKEQNRATSRLSEAESREAKTKQAGENFQNGSFANSILP